MTSRLDRLFVLLEAGTSAVTRRAAARQLGEVQRAHPEELYRLLARVTTYLRSLTWETRIAASQAVEAILANVPGWDPPAYSCEKEEPCDSVENNGRLRCETFDIEQVLKYGAHLMGSEGNEYDIEDDSVTTADLGEKITRQRQLLNARLGLDVASKLGMDLSDVYTNEDLCPAKSPAPIKNEPLRRPVAELVPISSSKTMSAREMNLAKRRARQAVLSKQKSRESHTEEGGSSAPATPTDEPDKKKLKREPCEELLMEECGPACDGSWGETSRWPLEVWACALQAQLCSSLWEARHGAASALRELLRAPIVSSAGKELGMSQRQMEDAHQAWLEDMALRLVCVLALDRFGDFVSDQVVAPVRETCAQTLGVVLSQLRESRVRCVADLLARLAQQPQWEARHGALLGFKYLVAARQEVACSSGALEQLTGALADGAEDVSAVAAGALAPAAAALVRARPAAVPEVAARLWQLLRDQDDLAAAANSYMALLASLIALPQAATLLQPINLSDVLPRLWPYLEHTTSSVRKATLQTMRTLTRPLTQLRRSPVNGENISIDHTYGKEEDEYLLWSRELLQDAMRHIYQRVLFEHVQEIQQIAEQVWGNLVKYAALDTVLMAACPLMSTWMCLAMQPARLAADPALLLQPPIKEKKPRPLNQPDAGGAAEVCPVQKWFVGGCESLSQNVRDRNVMRARYIAARMLGLLSCYIVQPSPGIEYKPEDESPVNCYVKVLLVYLHSRSALQRLVVGLVISAWAQHSLEMNLFPTPQTLLQNGENETDTPENGNVMVNGDSSHSDDRAVSAAPSDPSEAACLAPPTLTHALHTALNQTLYYEEMAVNCNKILQEARDLIATMKHYKLPVNGEEYMNIVRLEQVTHMTQLTQPMVAAMKLKRVAQTLEERRQSLHTEAMQCAMEQGMYSISVQAALAGACVNLHSLPERLNPVVRPIMESLKKECHEELQQASANNLAVMVAQLCRREPCPNAKVLVNLKAFLRCDPDFTPRVGSTERAEDTSTVDSGSGESGAENSRQANQSQNMDKFSGILTLWEQLHAAERASTRRGRPPAPDLGLNELFNTEDEAHKLIRIQRRGATLALTSLTKQFGDDLPQVLPKLWEFIIEPFTRTLASSELESQEAAEAEELISCLQVVEVVSGALGGGLWPRLLLGAPALSALTQHRFAAVRHMAARCLAALAVQRPADIMQLIISEVVPALSDMGSERVRCGAAETLARTVDALQLQVVPYIVLLVVPLLGRMSDHHEPVRLMSTRCFATLIQLMPLDGAVPEPADLSDQLRQRKAKDKHFLDQLFRPKSIKDYKIPIKVSAELRSYQQAGVNWLRFLNEYKLHGVLCDDMGLGKTLQSLVVVAGDHWERAQAYAAERTSETAPLPSLVVCPPTLTGHWVYEVKKFIPNKYLKPLQYIGPPIEREKLRKEVKHYNLIVASYDIVRKDIEFFCSLKWNYCILDEGHVIKNGKTKAFKAIKMLVANHRLILSGTPIQNNVLELWSLFDFLMPGLLGTERQFTARYSRPILAARDAKATPHHQQAGALAMEALHRQVLPFLLRRVKEDVLKELPPKITQDYYCELSPLQRRIYEDFSRAHMPQGLNASGRTHVFQALRYLQNVCNHPKLVLTDEHPEYASVTQQLTNLHDIEHSAKLPALKQLLLDCGIGATGNPAEGEAVLSQHRALVFCRLKAMLDIVEKDLLRRHLPSVSYLRLDGSVPPGARHSIVMRFNNDPSIDLLLLTTAVGGLGLNLTGADTVIFVEHDWNPMKDLQAMDRAHRIGQKKVVNVYRLITRDTLEEKIMGLQKFKLLTANTVISSENAAIETMGTDQLLDLFHLSSGAAGGQPTPTSSAPAAPPLHTLPDLWDDKQYEEEYDMTTFIRSLNKKPS